MVSHVITFCAKVPKSDKDYDLRVPKDMAYIFSGAYIPLSCKLIEQVRKPTKQIPLDAMLHVCCCVLFHLQVMERDSWTGLEEVTRLINSPEFTVTG